MSVQPARRPFTVDEYYRMAEVGIIGEGDRIELIEGEIIQMSPMGSRHASCIDRLAEQLSEQLHRRAILRVQSPLRLDSYSEPEPDLLLMQRRDDFYAEAHPTPPDILLAVEVADTSVTYDRGTKIPLYARVGIMEVWIVDLVGGLIEMYRDPSNGAYRSIRRAMRGESIDVAAFSDIVITVDDILG